MEGCTYRTQPIGRLPAHRHRARCAMHWTLEIHVCLQRAEEGQHVLVRPGRRPPIEVRRRPADEICTVDGARASEDMTAHHGRRYAGRQFDSVGVAVGTARADRQRAIVEHGRTLGRRSIPGTGLEQDDGSVGILAEPRSDDTTTEPPPTTTTSAARTGPATTISAEASRRRNHGQRSRPSTVRHRRRCRRSV